MRNVERDQLVCRELRAKDWRVLVVWECETEDVTALRQRLAEHLGTAPGSTLRGDCRDPRQPIG